MILVCQYYHNGKILSTTIIYAVIKHLNVEPYALKTRIRSAVFKKKKEPTFAIMYSINEWLQYCNNRKSI